MPSWAREARSCSGVILFWAAIWLTVLSTSASPTRMPVLSARATCRRPMIRRFSTWPSSRLRGGSWEGLRWYWVRIWLTARSSSLCSTTSSSTTATMRSRESLASNWASERGDAAARQSSRATRATSLFIGDPARVYEWRSPVASGGALTGRPAPQGGGRRQSEIPRNTGPGPEPAGSAIAKDSTPQEVVRLLADRADTLEFQLEIQGVGGIAGDVVHVVPGQDAPGRAAVVVLHAEEAFQGLAVAHRVVPAPHQAPAFADRHQGRDVALLEDVAAVAIGDVEHAVLAEAALHREGAEVGADVVGVPLVRHAQAPAVVEAQVELADVVRAGIVGRRLARQLHVLVVEIADLAEAGRQPLHAAVAFQQPAGEGQGEIVRVFLAVGAGETVGAEQLAEVEADFLRVEHRQVRLVAVRYAQVEQARFQGLQEIAAEEMRVALEDQARIQAADRQGAGRRLVGDRIGRRRVIVAHVQGIAGIAYAQLRTQEPRRALQRQGQVWIQVQALAVDWADVPAVLAAAVLVDGHELALDAAAQRADQIVLAFEGGTRLALVGFGQVRQGRIGDLVAVAAHARRPPAAAPGQIGAGRQQAGRHAGEGAAEILEIAIVGHVVQVHRQAPVGIDVGGVLEVEIAAFAAGFAIVGQVGEFHLALAGIGEVAELAAEHEAAVHDDAREQGGVVIRREVQVI